MPQIGPIRKKWHALPLPPSGIGQIRPGKGRQTAPLQGTMPNAPDQSSRHENRIARMAGRSNSYLWGRDMQHSMLATQNGEIKAIHIADLEDLLKRHGQLDDFVGGRMKCPSCFDVITSENAGSMKKVSGRFVLACNKIPCYEYVIKSK